MSEISKALCIIELFALALGEIGTPEESHYLTYLHRIPVAALLRIDFSVWGCGRRVIRVKADIFT